MEFQDDIFVTDTVNFLVIMSPNLICCTKRLVDMTIKSDKDEEVSCLSMATITMAINAIEAFLLELSKFSMPDTYTKKFRNGNIARKFEKLTNKKLEDVFPDVYDVIHYRHDIVHHEPQSKRALSLGTVTNIEGAIGAAKTLEKFVSEMLNCPEAKIKKNWTFVKID